MSYCEKDCIYLSKNVKHVIFYAVHFWRIVMNFIVVAAIFLFSFAGIAKAETLNVFFGSVLRAGDVWGDVI